MNRLLRACINRTMCKRLDERKLDVRHLHTSALCYEPISSNVVAAFCADAEEFYFRECLPRMARQAFVQYAIDRFFVIVRNTRSVSESEKEQLCVSLPFSDEITEAFQKYIDERPRTRRFCAALLRAGRVAEKGGFCLWERDALASLRPEKCGLTALPRGCDEIAAYFIWYMRAVAAEYRTRNIVRGRKYLCFSAVKTMASAIVSRAFGMERLIARSWWCTLTCDDGRTLFGVATRRVPGVRMCDAGIRPDGALQRELLNLNALDALCFQTDHAANNYHVVCKDGTYTLCAFDNDNPNTFLPIPTLRVGLSGCTPIVNRRGLLNRPYFCRETAQAIWQADLAALRRETSACLNAAQRAALICRVKKMRRMLRKTRKRTPEVLTDVRQWGTRTLAAECAQRYGKTYLTAASEKRGDSYVTIQE